MTGEDLVAFQLFSSPEPQPAFCPLLSLFVLEQRSKQSGCKIIVSEVGAQTSMAGETPKVKFRNFEGYLFEHEQYISLVVE